MPFKTNSLVVTLLIYTFVSCEESRYGEENLEKAGPHFIEIYPKLPKYGKIEREFRVPKKNFTKKEPLYEITTKRKQDELNFNDNFEKYGYKKHYVKISKIPDETSTSAENLVPVETTLEKYKHFAANPEFITSRHTQKPSTESPKNTNENKHGFFTKVNTLIRDQFSKMFNPFKDSNSSESSRKFGTKSFDKYLTRYGTIERVKDKKNKRFLNIFTILQFENSRCQAQGSFLSYEGTCYHRTECQSLGGFIMGACAKGFGVCCVCE